MKKRANMRGLFTVSVFISLFFCFELFAQNLTLVYPKSDQVLSSNKIKLIWDQYPGASNYDVQVSVNAGFTSPQTYNSILENTLEINTNLFNSYVYWRVKANNSLFSAIDSFFIFRASSVSGCEVWLNPDTLVNIVGTNKIQAIDDLTDNVNIASQTNDARRPLLANESLFEKKIISINGSQDMAVPLSPSSNYSFFIIASTGSAKSGNECVLSSAIAPGARWAIGMGSSALDGAGWAGPGSNVLLGNTNHINLNQYYLLNYRKNSTDWDITTNSSFIRNVADNSSPTYTGNYLWNIGSESGNYTFSGNVGSILIYNQSLTTYSTSIVENYLYDYYAPPVDLGENKIVCSFPLDLTIHQKPYYTSYTWQDGSVASSYTVTVPGTYSVEVTDVFGRQSSDTIVVSQDVANYTVSLGSDRSFCSGDSLFIYAGLKHLQYNWTGGSNENFIKVKTPGTYTVSVTDCLSNVTTDDIIISENNLPVFSLGSDRVFCFNSDTLLTVSFGFPVTYTWQNNSSNDSILVNHSGIYSLKIADQNGCIYNDDVTITIDSSLFAIDLGPDLFLCAGNQISLITGNSQVSSYSWSPTNDITSHTTVGGTDSYYYLDATNSNLCKIRDSVYVTITGQAPTADFVFNTTCFGTDMQFSSLAVPPSGNSIVSYTWSFGEPSSGVNNTSIIKNPIHNYLSDGNFDVFFEVETEIGCKQSITKQVTVFPLPQADFFNHPACAGTPTTFVDASIAFNSTIQNWQWYFSNGTTSNVSSPSTIFSSSQTHVVTLTVITPEGCTNTLHKTIFVNPSPTVDFITTPLCLGTIVTFTNTSVMPFPQTVQSVIWNYGNGQTAFSPISFQSYSTAGNYDVSLQINSSIGCSHVLTKTLTVTPNPQANFTYSNNCLNDNTLLSDISSAPFSAISKRVWEFDNTIISTLSTSSFLFNSTGNKNVKLTVNNINGCANSVTKTILVKPLPVASFSYSPAFVTPGETTSFINLAQNATSYTWFFGNGFSSNLFKPTTIFPDSGLYVVSLVAKDEVGCKDSVSKTIEVLFSKLDLGIFALSAKVSSDNFLEISTDLINYGTKPITDFKLLSSVNSESSIRETWTGDLKRGQLLPYVFTSSVQLDASDTVNAYVCVKIVEVNDLNTDDDITNNERCISFRMDRFIVLAGFPNPTETNFTLPIILPEDGDVSVEVYNELGQIVFNKMTQFFKKGLNTITIDVNYIEKGVYFYKINYQDKVAKNRFVLMK